MKSSPVMVNMHSEIHNLYLMYFKRYLSRKSNTSMTFTKQLEDMAYRHEPIYLTKYHFKLEYY